MRDPSIGHDAIFRTASLRVTFFNESISAWRPDGWDPSGGCGEVVGWGNAKPRRSSV